MSTVPSPTPAQPLVDGTPHTVSVIVPCRNERAHIGAFCRAALAQRLPPGWGMELLVADGQSDDGTVELLATLVAAEPRLRLIHNPGRIVSTGLNQALALATGEVVVRMDVHTDYADDYLQCCLTVLAETGADNVGGPWVAEPAEGAGPAAQAVAAAFQSRWVAGGARSRQTGFSGWVDTVYLGCWPRAVFDRVGGFDEQLVRNQDDEHNLRLRRAGGRIWQDARIRSRYRPRARLGQVFRQWLQYGYWKPFVMKKHGQPAALRHLVPAAWVGATGVSLLATVFGLPVGWLAAWLGLYALGLLVMTAGVALERKPPVAALLRVPAVILAHHLGYGLGWLAGGWDVLRHGQGRARFAGLTR